MNGSRADIYEVIVRAKAMRKWDPKRVGLKFLGSGSSCVRWILCSSPIFIGHFEHTPL